MIIAWYQLERKRERKKERKFIYLLLAISMVIKITTGTSVHSHVAFDDVR